MTPTDPEIDDAVRDPIAIHVANALITPGIARFAELRPDATHVEVQAAGQLLVLMGLTLTRLSRLETGLETAKLQPGTDGKSATDYIFLPTDRDTVEGRKAAAVALGYVIPAADQSADDMPVTAPAVPAEPEGQPTSCRWIHSGMYL
jgi:hypothetical protein